MLLSKFMILMMDGYVKTKIEHA